MPNGTYSSDILEYFPDQLDAVLSLVLDHFPIDPLRINCVGYSMGSHGCFELAAAYPNVSFASLVECPERHWSSDG